MITQGDGSFQAALDDGRCPKCKTKYPEGKLGECPTCELKVDSKTWSGNIKDNTSQTKETDMYETRLMPTEEEIVEDGLRAKVSWSVAVGKIEEVINQYLYDPEAVSEDHEREVLEAWRRVLMG